jgi:hypothetical protein
LVVVVEPLEVVVELLEVVVDRLELVVDPLEVVVDPLEVVVLLHAPSSVANPNTVTQAVVRRVQERFTSPPSVMTTDQVYRSAASPPFVVVLWPFVPGAPFVPAALPPC